MELEDYYLQLRTRFPDRPQGQELPITLDELSFALDCTRRNAQLLILKMIDRNFLEWQPGRGRGNRSRLTFLQDKDELILHRAEKLAKEGDVNAALQFLERHADERLTSEFQRWLFGQFGFHKRPNEEDVLRFPFYRPIPDLDPMNVIRRTEAHMIRQILDTLVVYDEAEKRVKPGLAHHWEHNKARTEWTFYLRKGVRFHHGKRMNAEDVKYTFERIRADKPGDWFLANIEGIELLGSTSLRFRLREPNTLFLSFLSAERFSIVPDDLEQIAARQDIKRLPIGTGPFRITDNTDSLLVLQANDFYYGGRPYLDRVETWVWEDYKKSSVMASDPAERMQVLYFDALARQRAERVLYRAEAGSTYLSFNLIKEGPLQDSRLRAAVHWALNREEMIGELGGRRMKISSGFDPLNDDEAYGLGDQAKARELLKASEYRGEVLRLYTYALSSNEQDAEWIRERLSRIGLNVDPVVLPIRELSQADAIAEADMILAGEVLGVEPSVTLIDMYRSSEGYIRNHLDEPSKEEVDAELSAALRETDSERRTELLLSIEESLRGRHLVLFLYHSHQTVGFDPALNGTSLNAWGKIDYKEIWLKENP
ncbi:SgrR family transcriptional regulator [Cohnella sp. AR92]|uniref:SgrR family transcriptional regulator n=1 Tax=Cohnella sp. AR92 TaxID=648716 RepID=UPI000F8E081E|nr:SgrR family transcriptional regulator [Cohnella sp. AR92]RUS46878.1 SgrR family transcriptional regulator [Cohnella sp. AR92]